MIGALRTAFGYPLLYAAAAVSRRRLRAASDLAPEAALDFARAFRWRGGHINPTQASGEILRLLAMLREEPLRAVVEIGTAEGGTLFLWTRVAAPDAVLVTVDVRPLGVLGRFSPWALVRRAFARGRQRVELVMGADSHDPATVAEVRRLLDGRAADFLFVDGDHGYEGVKRDFELYAPLVRPGGLIAFHDVAEPSAPGVMRFWQEVKQGRETEELVADARGGYGIGVIRVPAANTIAS